jgi:cyclophilin family peptidyl-prolyl cis-trans isomerase
MKPEKLRMKPVKLKTVKSKRNATRNVIDHLERRMMLSVAIKAQIPNTTLQAGGTAQTLNMAPYFDDAAIPSTDTVVEFQTNLPSPDNLIPVELTTAATPNTVANFLQYIANGDYSDTVFQRSVPGFVIQGGGFTDTGSAITALGTVNGESSTATLNNTAGTIAMALSSGPNTGSNQWFFNLVNNNGTSAPYDINLDNTSDGGPFTAFGQVIYQGMTVLNDIANLPVVDDTGQGDGQWSSLPVQSGTNGATVTTEATSNLVTLDPIVIPGGLVYAQPNVSNTSVVTATMTQNNLTLTPVGPGTTTVQIEAIDLGLGHVFETFNVTVDAASAKPAVYIGNANGTVGTNSKIVFPITLSNASSSAITFNYSLTSGTAPAGDYQSTASSLTIPAGATSASIPVNLVQDSSGTSENFTITLSGLSSNAVFGSNAATETATGTINPAGTISTEVSIENASGTVGTNSQIVFPVALSAASPSATTFDYSLTADTAASTDYSATGSMVTIPAGSTTASIPVTVIGDSSGAPETFAITLSDVSANALFSSGQATESAIGTINPGAPQASTTTLTASSPVVDLNGAENFTATVTQSGIGPTPTGTVTFELGGASIGTANLSSGVATLSTNLSTAGNDNFTAVYGGDSANLASTSSAVTVNVATLAPAVSRSTVPTSVVSGTPVKGTTTVGLTNDTSTTQKGKVTVKIYASTNGVIDANSVLVAAVTRSVSIAAGKTVNVPVAVTSFPATLPSNTYTLLSQSINTSGQISNRERSSTVRAGNS